MPGIEDGEAKALRAALDRMAALCSWSPMQIGVVKGCRVLMQTFHDSHNLTNITQNHRYEDADHAAPTGGRISKGAAWEDLLAQYWHDQPGLVPVTPGSLTEDYGLPASTEPMEVHGVPRRGRREHQRGCLGGWPQRRT